jgi:DNA polymerase-3 subunit delta'
MTDASRPGLDLPWLGEALSRARSQRGHALLIHGPQGLGQWELALHLAMDRLCEAEPVPAEGVVGSAHCGHCASCRLVQSQSHPDLMVLMPAAQMQALGWMPGGSDGGEAEAAGEKSSKSKPSKEIKVDAVRAAIAFTQSTSARGRGKVLLMVPAERMNAVSANALLKTLEEPPGQSLYLLVSHEPALLLPTLRSRCQALALTTPDKAMAVEWLRSQGVSEPEPLLAAAGGQVQVALAWAQEGLSDAMWQALPQQVAKGEVGRLAEWPLPRLIDMLTKLCHDALCIAAGAPPRYFAPRAIRFQPDAKRLLAWQRELQAQTRHAEHPWQAALATEALVQRAAQALA